MSLNWYVLRAISGKENKIKTYLEKEINRNKLEKYIPEVMIPYEKVYVMRNGKKKIKEKNYFPGYVLVSADFTHGEVQHVIKNVPGVIGFLGSGTGSSRVPIPLREAEINRIFGKFDEANITYSAIDYYEGKKENFITFAKGVKKDHPYVRSFKWVFDLPFF